LEGIGGDGKITFKVFKHGQPGPGSMLDPDFDRWLVWIRWET